MVHQWCNQIHFDTTDNSDLEFINGGDISCIQDGANKFSANN